MHIQDPDQKRWIQEHVEGVSATHGPEEQRHILDRLNAAEAFEQFLDTKYVGQKRFGLEGAESAIPLLDAVLDEAAEAGQVEAVLGMAHRGRLNVLINIVGKSYGELFEEFEGNIDPDTIQGSGDVKYHKGATRQVHRPVRQDHRRRPGVQPLPPRGGRPGGRGHGPGQAGPARRRPASIAVLPAPGPRRRRLRRPGRGGRDAQPVGPRRLPHRRHRPPRHQQPARLHHHPGVGPLLGLRHRRGQDGPGADLPRQRRRPRGVRPGRPGWPSPSARRSTRTSSSTWSATAATATTRATTRASPSR